MMMRRHVFTAICGAALTYSAAGQADIDVYGKLHLSTDYVDNFSNRANDNQGFADTTLSSNSSRLGFKGEHELNYGFTAMWKLESDVDLAGERDAFKARNRYIGMQHAYGSLIAGYHDTPMKTLGSRADLFSDTIGDRRNIIGSGNGTLKTDIRARNSSMYTSPIFSGVEFRLMGSVGGDADPTLDSQYMVSSSISYDQELFFVGIAAEHQTTADIAHDGARLVAGFSGFGFKVNALYEWMNSNSVDSLSRSSLGGGIMYSMLDTHFKAQAFYATDYGSTNNTTGLNYAVGASQTFSKKLEVYLVFSQTLNASGASFSLGGGGHGETFIPSEAGANLIGISGGLSYTF